MKLSAKQAVCILGVILGIGIIIAGIAVMNPETYTIGEPFIKFGADFYTEIYDVTRSVGGAVQRNYKNICNAIGWLIISLGAIDISYFLLKLVDTDKQENGQNTTHPTHSSAYARPIATQAPKEESVEAPKIAQKQEETPASQVENTLHEEYWVCGKCKTKNLKTRADCWSCGNPK